MTELYKAAVVKLPRKSRHSSIIDSPDFLSKNKAPLQEETEPDYSNDFLVSDKLYLNGLPLNVTEEEVMDLVKNFDPIQ
jgi:hypothetical protein